MQPAANHKEVALMFGRSKRRDLMAREQLPGWLNGVLIFGTLAVLVISEIKRPLRKTREDKLRHDVRNIAMSVMTSAAVSLTEKPLTSPLSRVVLRNRWGVLKMGRLPVRSEILLSIILLDYTLYLWHYLTHKIPFLWRFHRVHHVDLDLNASTALRFHAAEMVLSVPWRAGQVLVLGISPLALAIWQTLTLVAILFHHSNVRLPAAFERRLCRLIVTPRMHGIHHSIVHEETASNWSTIFTWPDYLHGTIRLNVPQDEITIGVPAFQNPDELTIGKLIKMPFTADRASWKFAGNGKPERKKSLPLPRTTLAS
jgi:sterol desaturase/sphingolipid hydroxylase (fatty acid hydroxylase superfamily)